MKIKEYDLVKALVAREGWPTGVRGPVVDICGDGDGVTIEVWDDQAYPIGDATYSIDEVELIAPDSPDAKFETLDIKDRFGVDTPNEG